MHVQVLVAAIIIIISKHLATILIGGLQVGANTTTLTENPGFYSTAQWTNTLSYRRCFWKTQC